MPRRRLAVAILAPPGPALEVDVLRRAVGVPEPFHVAPHVTLVPPLNLRAEDLGDVLALLRAAASAAEPCTLTVGPAATFAPETPTLHLAVGGDERSVDALRALRAAVRAGPLDRPDEWPFTPHVTLHEQHDVDAIPAAVATLRGVRQRWPVDRLHLLEQRRRHDASVHWVPVHEEPLGGPAVVGRGGAELVLRTVGMVEEPVADRWRLPAAGPPCDPSSPRPLAVVAERPGAPGSPVGAAVGRVGCGRTARLDAVVVAEEDRGTGVGAHLLAAWSSAAADHGADLVRAAEDPSGFLRRHGYASAAGVWVRGL